LTQLVIRNKAHQHNWPISTYVPPAQDKNKDKTKDKDEEKKASKGIQLPRDIFHNLTDHQAGLDVSTLSLYRADD